MDRAIEATLRNETTSYPERTAFVDAEEAYAGREITRALENGYAVVLVSPDGREHVLTERLPAA